jgi:hypothetical protein
MSLLMQYVLEQEKLIEDVLLRKEGHLLNVQDAGNTLSFTHSS